VHQDAYRLLRIRLQLIPRRLYLPYLLFQSTAMEGSIML